MEGDVEDRGFGVEGREGFEEEGVSEFEVEDHEEEEEGDCNAGYYLS